MPKRLNQPFYRGCRPDAGDFVFKLLPDNFRLLAIFPSAAIIALLLGYQKPENDTVWRFQKKILTTNTEMAVGNWTGQTLQRIDVPTITARPRTTQLSLVGIRLKNMAYSKKHLAFDDSSFDGAEAIAFTIWKIRLLNGNCFGDDLLGTIISKMQMAQNTRVQECLPTGCKN